jgi:DNA replication protein DnaC
MARLSELLPQSQVPPEFAKQVEPPTVAPDPDVCQECGGLGYVRVELSIDDPNFGRPVQCRCVDAESQRERTDRLQQYSNIGPLSRLTFDNLISRGRSSDPRDQTHFQRCVDHAQAFAKDPQGWLVLVGASGCGKTHIAAAITNRCLELGTPALFVVVPDLLDHLRAAYRPDAEISYDQLFEQVRTAPVLVLDDLGTQSATPWAEEKLYQLINHRYNARLPTVITTNKPLRKLDDRLRTRLGDPSLSQPHADPISTVHLLEERRPLEDLGMNMIGLPMIQEMTFESFDLTDFRSPRDQTQREQAYRAALDFADNPDGWMVLLGGRARDRTHLAAAIANRRRMSGELPVYVQISDFLDSLRRTINDDDQRDFDRIKKTARDCPFLILEDLEVGMRSDWVRDQLFQTLNPRCLARLPTVITTPHTLTKLVTDPGWERLARLLTDPRFSSEIVVGETPQEEQTVAPKKPRGRGAAKRT